MNSMHDAPRRGRDSEVSELHQPGRPDHNRALALTEDILALTEDILSRLEPLLEAAPPRRRPEPPHLRLVPPGT